jgi:hypothetical protein
VTARAVYEAMVPLLLSRRAAFRLLGVDRCGEAAEELVRSGRLRLVPAGRQHRVPLEDVQRVAREGFTVDGKPGRAVSRPRRGVPAPGVGSRIRALEIES